jgi:6-phosphogluconate dehydrogenase
MTEQSNVINIDGKSYRQSDLSVEQLRLASKVAKWQKQTNDLKDLFEDANILQQQYLQALKTSLSNDETTKAMESSKAS